MGENISGAILAAGTGERLRAAAHGLPKPLAEIAGRTLLGRQAEAILDAGAGRVLAIVNSETARLIRERRVKLPDELELVVRDTPNSMETLFAIGERLRAGYFLLATVDAIIPHPEFRRFVAESIELVASSGASNLNGVLAVARWGGDRRPLFAEIAADGVISGLGGPEAPFVTAGVYFFSTAIFRSAEQARASRLGAMREYLAYLVGSGMRFKALEVSGAIDVDEGPDLEAARAMLADRSDSAFAADSAFASGSAFARKGRD